MRIEDINQKSFRGYDVMPLRGFYMQGLYKRGHRAVFNEMKQVASKEGVDLYLNSGSEKLNTLFKPLESNLLCWAQDCVTFIKRLKGSDVLWKIKEDVSSPQKLLPFDNFEIYPAENYPRGGNYYLGYNDKGERWLLINSMELKQKNKPTEKELSEVFAVEPKNIIILDLFDNDLDELVRPIKYPYILVNDWEEVSENIKNFKKEYPNASNLYMSMEDFLAKKKSSIEEPSTEYICNTLQEYGFVPIRIAGRYHYDINYLNAFAWENKEGNISYLTNSVKDSYVELEYFENLFKETLKERVLNIGNMYFISGGPRTLDEKDSESSANLYSPGFYNDNVIMDLLAAYEGGIHCLTAEIPEELF